MNPATTKRYRVEDFDGEGITVDIDHSVVTEQSLSEINDFWSNSSRRLENAEGNLLLCVLRLLWEQAMHEIIADWNAVESFKEGKMEGWPPLDGSAGWELISCDEHEFDPGDVNYREIGRKTS